VTDIDARIARRRFDRAAPTYAGAARIESEVGARMLERLDFVRLAPSRILDAGSGPAPQAAALARRYAGVRLIAVDSRCPCCAMRVRSARARLRGARRPAAVCAAWSTCVRRGQRAARLVEHGPALGMTRWFHACSRPAGC
jgi:malonyl-CoA O-methyltransferase